MAERRRAVQLLVVAAAYLTAGAAISVAVAVGIGLWGRVTPTAHGLARVQNGAIVPDPTFFEKFGAVDWSTSRGLLPDLANRDMLDQALYRGPGTTDVLTNVLRMGFTINGFECMMIHQTGWPMRALEYRFLGVLTGRLPNNASGCAAPPWLARERYDAPFTGAWRPPPILVRPPIPLRPLPLGLAVDASFYGGILFALYGAFGPVRRALRRRRDLCPSCGYSLAGLAAGSACPECGQTGPHVTRRGDT